MRQSLWSRRDWLIAVATMVIGIAVGNVAISSFTRAGNKPLFYQAQFGPAALWACGRGFVNPPTPAIVLDPLPGYLRSNTPAAGFESFSAFLRGERESFDCRELPSSFAAEPPVLFQGAERYLFYATVSRPEERLVLSFFRPLEEIKSDAQPPQCLPFCALKTTSVGDDTKANGPAEAFHRGKFGVTGGEIDKSDRKEGIVADPEPQDLENPAGACLLYLLVGKCRDDIGVEADYGIVDRRDSNVGHVGTHDLDHPGRAADGKIRHGSHVTQPFAIALKPGISPLRKIIVEKVMADSFSGSSNSSRQEQRSHVEGLAEYVDVVIERFRGREISACYGVD